MNDEDYLNALPSQWLSQLLLSLQQADGRCTLLPSSLKLPQPPHLQVTSLQPSGQRTWLT